MVTQDELIIHDYCPVCRSLPLDKITFGVEGPLLEYYLHKDEVDFKPVTDEKYEKCALYFLTQTLAQIWSGQVDFPPRLLPKGNWFVEQWTASLQGTSLESTCRDSKDPNCLMVKTDPRSLVGRLQKPNFRQAVHSDPRDPLVLARMREWIQICDELHEGCHVDEIPLLPTRVLYIANDAAPYVVKLLETTKGQRGQYVALSHCWGVSNPFVTTANNLEDMKAGFTLDQAPATFRDAITLCQDLEIRYIWIDSLCIIQGDVKDWEVESAHMAGIYRDATLTLSASRAAADSEGFLQLRPVTHSKLKISSPTGQNAEVYLQAREPDELRGYWDFRKDQQPLDTRGWCLQETYLSRRQIMFLHSGILWSCRDAMLDESHEDQFQGMPGSGASFTLPNILRGHMPRQHRSINLSTPYHQWYVMISNFTNRRLTFVDDKFPALSGLASAVAEHDKGAYLAGIWWEDAVFGICWKKTSILSKVNKYIAPSWSWASVDGPVEFINSQDQPMSQTQLTQNSRVKLHDFHVETSGSNPYGHISSAWIKLEAPLAIVEKAKDGYFRISRMEDPESIEMSFDIEGETLENLSVLLLWRRDVWSYYKNEDADALTVKVFGLVIKSIPGGTEKFRELASESASQTYERVGFFQMMTTENREKGFWELTTVKTIVIV